MSGSRNRRRKDRRKNQARFYEALSIGQIPGAMYPTDEVRNPRQSFTSTKKESLNREAKLSAVLQNVLSNVQQIKNNFIHAHTAMLPKYQRATETTRTIFKDASKLGLAASNDIERYIIKLRRFLWGTRLKAIYLALFAIAALGLVVAGTILTISTNALYAKEIASPAALLSAKKTGITITDKTGKILFQGFGAQDSKQVPLSQVPQDLKSATLAAEDPSFYDHQGFSWRGTARAAWVDITQHGKVEGGSTLTQQLVKNAILTSNKTFERKSQEIILSIALENRYSKDQILEIYLNDTYYGQGSTGIEVAAETYFHRSVKDLSLAQSAMLAGLPLGPSRFDPNVNSTTALNRRNFVLDRMVQIGKISKKSAEIAKAEPLAASPRSVQIKAPHFVFYVLSQLKAQYGEKAVEGGGMTVKTTLDLDKQIEAEQIVARQIDKLSNNHVSNGGLISIEPSSGNIVNMVGSVAYDTPGFGAVNVTLSDLQPGSSFKPIAYVTAFEKGWNGSTQVDDSPISLPSGDGTQYVPQNYDNKFRGKVTLRRALANSLNIPAIKVMQFAGMQDTLKTAHDLGITGLNDSSQFGVSLVLGAGNVKPIDMATVYATFANNGSKVTPKAILSVFDRDNKNITKVVNISPQKVLDPKYAYMITSILSDNAARTEEFGPNSPLKLSRVAAAKTGTTNDFRDNWTVGYTPNLATAVWVGNNDHSAMSNIDGITGAAPIWHDYMEMANAGIPEQSFAMPESLTATKVCPSDGGLAGSNDPSIIEPIPTDQPLTRHCSTGDTNLLLRLLQTIIPASQPSPTPNLDTPPNPPSTPPPLPSSLPQPTDSQPFSHRRPTFFQ